LSDRLSLFLMGAVERFRIATPVNATASNWAGGSGPYDYNGDYVLLHAAANYGLSKRTKLNLAYQVTSSQGDNKNLLHEIWAGMNYRAGEDNSLKVGYEYFDFHDRRTDGPGFDDYKGHGLTASAQWEF
jgi:predicted porin